MSRGEIVQQAADSSAVAEGVELDELRKILHRVDPAVVLVPQRMLRRIIQRDLDLTGRIFRVPHDHSYVISRDRLLTLVDSFELAEEITERPATLILIDHSPLTEGPPKSRVATLRFCWRRLFHARIHAALEAGAEAEHWSVAGVRRRIQRLGVLEFAEARQVLRQDHQLLNPDDDRSAFVEFAAHYLELKHFAPAALAITFPSLKNLDDIDQLLAEDVNANATLMATQVKDGLTPIARGDEEELADGPGRNDLTPHAPRWLFRTVGIRLKRRADQARAIGNLARSALLRGHDAGIDTARRDLGQLASRLQAALSLNDDETRSWHEALLSLIQPADDDYWSPEARLLYDLQNVCVDYERELYAVDLVEWALWYFRRPVRRPLPLAREMLRIKNLRKVSHDLRAVRLSPTERGRMNELLRRAVRRIESGLRSRVEPLVAQALDEVKLHPTNLPERVARDKLIAELTDRVLTRGFLTFSDVRDMLARNQLKLPDLGGVGTLAFGDQLLLVDKQFAVRLDGIYKRAEFYLRWMQRLSSLVFGTNLCRLATLYAVIPFGGAYLVLEFLQHFLHSPLKSVTGEDIRLITWPTEVLLGAFFLGLAHSGQFRHAVVVTLRRLGRGFFWAAVTLPRALVKLRLVQWLIHSPPVAFFRRRLLEATALGLIAIPVGTWCGLDPPRHYHVAATLFTLAAWLFNTSLGHLIREAFADVVAYLRSLLWFDVLLGLFHILVEFFNWVAAGFERLMYSIDEWVRFRQDEGRIKLVVKVLLGVVWFFVSYVVRFAFTLLLEPQINPLKHFPTVTVAHKLLLPWIPTLTSVLFQTETMTRTQAATIATAVITGIPGIFGFLVWELKENWRLYQANRPKDLEPVVVGSHGETILRLLQPGFHSGTLPKLFHRLRLALAAERPDRRVRPLRSLHHVEDEVRHFIEREFVALLRGAAAWNGRAVEVADVDAGVKRIVIELSCPELDDHPVSLAWEEYGGRLLARVRDPAWLSRLNAAERQVFANALLGLYKLAGISLVHERLTELWGTGDAVYALGKETLRVWRPLSAGAVVTYSWTDEPVLSPSVLPGHAPHLWPPLFVSAVDLTQTLVTWPDWLAVWQSTDSASRPIVAWSLLPKNSFDTQ